MVDIEHLAALARIELTPEEKAKFPAELQKILNHFKELEKLDTSKVAPMTGGTLLKDVYREDFSRGQIENEMLAEAFPEKKEAWLKVPDVFDSN